MFRKIRRYFLKKRYEKARAIEREWKRNLIEYRRNLYNEEEVKRDMAREMARNKVISIHK